MNNHEKLKGYYIYEIPTHSITRGSLVYGLMEEGSIYDFGLDDTHTYIAVLGSDTDTMDIFNDKYKNNFVFSMGARSASDGSQMLEGYLKGDIIPANCACLHPRCDGYTELGFFQLERPKLASDRFRQLLCCGFASCSQPAGHVIIGCACASFRFKTCRQCCVGVFDLIQLQAHASLQPG